MYFYVWCPNSSPQEGEACEADRHEAEILGFVLALAPFSVSFLVMRLIGVCDSTTQAFGTYVEQSLHQNLRESFNSFLLAPLDQTKTYGKLHFVSAKDSTDVSQ
jgi:hypothetical protein